MSHPVVVYVPSPGEAKEEQSQHNVANITKDIIEGTEDSKGAGAQEVIVTDILISGDVEHLELDINMLTILLANSFLTKMIVSML
jgi:hypothetical protein